MRVLALDISSNKTGWALVKNATLESYGVLDIKQYKPNKLISNYTLYMFRHKLVELFDKTKPSRVAIENVYLGTNTKVALALAMMSGVARCLAYSYTKNEIATIYPSSVNKFLGFGRVKRVERKKLLVKMVYILFDLKLLKKDDDIADAIGIGFVAFNKFHKGLKIQSI